MATVGLVAGVVASPMASRADIAPAPPTAADGLTGDWDGLRTRLAGEGVIVTGGYISELAYDARGGERRTVAEAGEFDLGVKADLGRLAGLRGGTFKATLTDRRGLDLGRSAGLGVLQEVQEINGRGHTWRLTEFWYEQALGRVRVKVGRSPPNVDFAAFSCEFQNLSLCSAAAGEFVTDTWFNWPVAEWSARIRLDLRDVYVQAGGFVINPHDLEKGVSLGHIGGASGALYPVEIGWTPTVGGRPGRYRLGGWRSTVDTRREPPAAGAAASPGPRRASRWGGWFNAEQRLSAAPAASGGAGPSVFFNFTQADRRTAEIDQQIATGLFYGGPLPGRPDDIFGLGFSRTHLSGHLDNTVVPPSASLRAGGAEYAAEAYYKLRPRPWLSLSPNLQVVQHPGGDDRRRPVIVVGLKAGLSL